MSEPAVVILEALGTKNFPRWLIAARDGRFWDGRDWTTKRHDAFLYAHIDTASRDADEILRLEYDDKPCLKRISVPLLIEDRSDQAVDVESLKAWLKKAATLYVDYRQHGNGPDGSLVLLAINWEAIK